VPRIQKINFVVTVHFANGKVETLRTKQIGFDAAMAYGRSRHFQSVKDGTVNMIAVKKAGLTVCHLDMMTARHHMT
jgi:hypothetical protein